VGWCFSALRAEICTLGFFLHSASVGLRWVGVSSDAVGAGSRVDRAFDWVGAMDLRFLFRPCCGWRSLLLLLASSGGVLGAYASLRVLAYRWWRLAVSFVGAPVYRRCGGCLFVVFLVFSACVFVCVRVLCVLVGGVIRQCTEWGIVCCWVVLLGGAV